MLKCKGTPKLMWEIKPGQLFCHPYQFERGVTIHDICLKTEEITGSLGREQYNNIQLNCVGISDGEFGCFAGSSKVVLLTEIDLRFEDDSAGGDLKEGNK